MSIDCAFYGFLAADADARTSKAGKPWVPLRVGVGKDDNVQWVNLAVFGKAAEAAAALKKSDRIYVEGTIKLDTWRGNDGIETHSNANAHTKSAAPKKNTAAPTVTTMISAFPPTGCTEHVLQHVATSTEYRAPARSVRNGFAPPEPLRYKPATEMKIGNSLPAFVPADVRPR
jgi:single-stranded DNA-binding protein